jgi:hypothetical protein
MFLQSVFTQMITIDFIQLQDGMQKMIASEARVAQSIHSAVEILTDQNLFTMQIQKFAAPMEP